MELEGNHILKQGIFSRRRGMFIVFYPFLFLIPFILGFGFRGVLGERYGDKWWMVPLIASTLIATTGPFLYIHFQRKEEDKRHGEQRKYQLTLRNASLGMGRIKDLKRLLTLIVRVVTRTVRIEHSEIYLYHEQARKFTLKASRNEKFVPEADSAIWPYSQLVLDLNKRKELILYRDIKQRNKRKTSKGLLALEKELKALDAELVVPSFIKDKLTAIIILGRKKSGEIYTQDDMAVFTILANQAALAIENAQFFEDMKNRQEQLFKAEKMATIGTMADGLSHQINNRLHAMGFIAGDVLDTIKLKKNGDMSTHTVQLLEKIEHALVRIEQNVQQGGAIVEGLLKYTRKGEEGFSPIDFDELLTVSLEMLQFKVNINELDIKRNYDEDIPKLKGNMVQMQEVLFNVIDNAYDAIKERQNKLKEDGYKGRLEIFASKNGKYLEILMRDNGIGVKEEDCEKLFSPFYTTKKGSRKGTGLGLYVVEKIVKENHGGKIRFASEYGVGSQVLLLIPIAVNKL